MFSFTEIIHSRDKTVIDMFLKYYAEIEFTMS